MKKVLLVWALALSLAGSGQIPEEKDALLDRIADELLSTAEEDVSYEELYETLTHLLANPVDINSVTREQLRAVMILNEAEINALLHYRDQQGPLMDLLELQAIPGWTPETIQRMVPFVTVPDANATVGSGLMRRIYREPKQYVVMRYEQTIENRPGYAGDAPNYTGNPDKYYMRYRNVRTNDFSLGFTAEKDPGEKWDWSPSAGTYGFDFYSGHLQLLKKGRLENLILGDFQSQFGQGLQFGSAFGLGKTAQTITGIRRSNLGFLPYMSASESYYLRGLAVTTRISTTIRLHAFFSQKQADGSMGVDAMEVRSLQTSGLHRTPAEIAAKGRVRDRDLGLVLQFRKGAWDAGIIFYSKKMSHSLAPDNTPYNQFQWRGDGFANLGGYVNLSWGNVTVFSEFAQTVGRGFAWTGGVMGNLTTKLEMAWLGRNFSADYYASYANAVAESSTPQNEQGLYWGMKYTFSRKVALHSYIDYFRFPWLRYRIYRPSEGSEWLARLDYVPNRSMNFFVQYREERKSRNTPAETNLYRVSPGARSNLWLGGEFSAAQGISLRARIQGSSFDLDGKTTRGMALVQEATWKQKRWSVTVRYALFDTDDYDNRQYVYEKDVWLATSLPAYDGTGVRNYILLHVVLSRHIDLWLRWSRTVYRDRDVIGSGSDAIQGNARNDVKFQVRIRP
jgi:hypothetical protein